MPLGISRVVGFSRALRASSAIAYALATFAITSCGGGDGATGASSVASLRFVTQPTTVGAGVTFTVSVELLSGDGKRLTSGKDVVTLAAIGTTLSGPSSVAAVSGLATFSGLTVTQAGATVQLSASVGSITTAGPAVNVTAGPPTPTQSTIAPTPGNVNINSATALTFVFKDSYGNPVAGATVTLAASLSTVTLTPSTGTTSSGGAFTTSLRGTAAGSVTISATVGGTTVAFATPFVLADLCPPATYSFPGPLNGSIPTGQCTIFGFASTTYRFSVPSQGGVAFTANSSAFSPIVEVSSDPPGDDVKIAIDHFPTTLEWILPTGSYQFRIGAVTGSGAFSFTGAVAPANTQCVQRFLVRGGTYTGQALATDDCNFGDDTMFDEYDVFDSRPCDITLNPTGFSAFIGILDPLTGYDHLLAAAPNTNPPPPAPVGQPVSLHLPACRTATGPIAIWLNNWNVGEIGPYTFTIAFTGAAATASAVRSGVEFGSPQVVRTPRFKPRTASVNFFGRLHN